MDDVKIKIGDVVAIKSALLYGTVLSIMEDAQCEVAIDDSYCHENMIINTSVQDLMLVCTMTDKEKSLFDTCRAYRYSAKAKASLDSYILKQICPKLENKSPSELAAKNWGIDYDLVARLFADFKEAIREEVNKKEIPLPCKINTIIFNNPVSVGLTEDGTLIILE